jgi:hypothetical protein
VSAKFLATICASAMLDERREALMRLIEGADKILFSEALAAEGRGRVRQGLRA